MSQIFSLCSKLNAFESSMKYWKKERAREIQANFKSFRTQQREDDSSILTTEEA
jgi:hypothetical protein